MQTLLDLQFYELNHRHWRDDKMRALITLALITGARIGELLAIRWEHVADDALTFLETKNGRTRRIPPLPRRERGPGGAAAGSRAPVRVHQSGDRRPLHDERRAARSSGAR
jgi:integrase